LQAETEERELRAASLDINPIHHRLDIKLARLPLRRGAGAYEKRDRAIDPAGALALGKFALVGRVALDRECWPCSK
jgi:hypothetical protein